MNKLLLLLLLPLFFSCSGDGDEDRKADCSAVLCINHQFILDYQDEDGNRLIGTTFVQDSFKLSSANRVLYIKPINYAGQDHLVVPFGKIENGVDYQLELDSTETDTFNFSFSTNQGDCCITFTMTTFVYNNETLSNELSDIYVLIR